MPFELLKSIGKTAKSSVPVLSAGPLYFLLSTLLAALGFSHFWPIAWAVCSAHAGSVHGVVRRLHFGSRTENRVVFRVALGPQNTEVLHGPVWPRSTPAEAVGFELVIPCSDDPLDSRIHESDGLLTILTIIKLLPVFLPPPLPHGWGITTCLFKEEILICRDCFLVVSIPGAIFR